MMARGSCTAMVVKACRTSTIDSYAAEWTPAGGGLYVGNTQLVSEVKLKLVLETARYHQPERVDRLCFFRHIAHRDAVRHVFEQVQLFCRCCCPSRAELALVLMNDLVASCFWMLLVTPRGTWPRQDLRA